MTITVEAIYENGVLKLSQPVPLREHEKIRVTLQTETTSIVNAYGIMGFTGSAEEADYFALSPDLDPLED